MVIIKNQFVKTNSVDCKKIIDIFNSKSYLSIISSLSISDEILKELFNFIKASYTVALIILFLAFLNLCILYFTEPKTISILKFDVAEIISYRLSRLKAIKSSSNITFCIKGYSYLKEVIALIISCQFFGWFIIHRLIFTMKKSYICLGLAQLIVIILSLGNYFNSLWVLYFYIIYFVQQVAVCYLLNRKVDTALFKFLCNL